MHLKIVGKFLILAFVATNALASPSSTPDLMPHIPMMAHQLMTMDGKVIYEADVDMVAPSRRQVLLRVSVDQFNWDCVTQDGVISTERKGRNLGEKLVSGFIITCVVKDLTADGSAKVDLIYTFRDPSQNVDKTEHVSGTVKEGHRFEKTTESGTHVAMLLKLDRF
ncbi:hypothetical protein QN382_03430 [Pseudomonas sp. 10B1]|uniref:hypothetical protein n=1 Tax=Pseudomonas sp. 10B1 TaxID=3048573 RepID=UPI002B230B00|nr:hypothetical protein [Pseudomonas sp. 10B1]MEB0308336.1 hypothetical protein [Pseudomonas sp. 10B1]